MRKLATFVVAAMLTAGIAAAQTATPAPAIDPPLESAKRIDQKKAADLVKQHKAIFVDVRGKDQYEIGHIKGAINIPLNELMTRLKELPSHKTIITYCA